MSNWSGSWIWTDRALPDRNAFLRLRRRFAYSGGPATLRVTADARYSLYVNGEHLGQGPIRAWPGHWTYDTYDLAPHLQAGENVVAALVQDLGEGNFQYVYAGRHTGLLAEIDLASESVPSDESWLCSPDPAFANVAPRVSVQLGFEEQFDARLADGWTRLDYDEVGWAPAVALRPAEDGRHRDLTPRSIPFLTCEPVLPQRVVSVEAVRSVPHRFTVYAKPYLLPEDRSSNMVYGHAYLATQVYAPEEVEIAILTPHKAPLALKLNGEVVRRRRARLRAGWNSLVASLRRPHHLPEYVLCLDGPDVLRFSATGDGPGSAWAVVGPFALGRRDQQVVHDDKDDSILVAQPLTEAATLRAGEEFWREGAVAAVVDEPFFQPVRPEHLPPVDAFAQSYTDRVVRPLPIRGDGPLGNAEALLSGADWAVVEPLPGGEDVRLLVDFGREVVGQHRFEVVAPAGTILDFHNFEFVQPDGRFNFAEGMNNSFRYVCREGRQAYQTYLRRGFQYSYLTLRNLTGPVRIRHLEALLATYPQSRRGSFSSSDAKLDRIWEVGAHTLRLCAEDSYTDCPTYEQTGWVGDARNEALIDWAVNGDPRLWYRHLELTAQSLDRSPIAESHVPSSWVNLLPAWTFLWMRSCREYLLHTGDREGSRKLLTAVDRNVRGFVELLNADGLFDVHAWNMFDWAKMDTPSRGVVTHQNCLAVHGLRDAAELADWLGESHLAQRYREVAASLAEAINAYLWSEERRAYTDCLRDGRPSEVYSQQTQTVAYSSGVAEGERGQRARELMHEPPEGFVKAGSPFFEFFLLEAYQREGRVQEFLDAVRRDWGFMVDMGATTFWEMWSGHSGRLTRSHCHGWSAAPTFFLSSYVLGVRPGGPGFQPAIVEPHPGDLAWCRGTVPTPLGDVEVQWENESGQPFALRVRAPEAVKVEIRLPREGVATLNGRTLR